MKIIHYYSGNPYPVLKTGIGIVIHNLAKSQASRGLEVEVWGKQGDVAGDEKPPEDYKVQAFPNPVVKFILGSTIKSAIQDLNPKNTVFHFHSAFVPEFHSLCKILKSLSIPWIISPHGSYGSMQKNALLKKIYMPTVERFILANAQAIHTATDAENQLIKSMVPNARVITQPYGQTVAKPSPRAAALKNALGPIIGFCGRIDMLHKGLDLLIPGFSNYCQLGGTGSLWLIGDGRDFEQFKELVSEYKLNDRVVCLGRMFGAEKASYLPYMDAFVHTSRWEGLPTALLEAASFRLPLLVNRNTNIDTYVEAYEAGWIIEENTPEEIGKYLLEVDRCYQRNQIEGFKENSFRMAQEVFDWDICAKKLEAEAYLLPSLSHS